MLLKASCLGALWAVSYFSGDLISITLDTDPNPICVGVAVTYTANDDGTPPSTYKWEYRCTDGGTADAWVLATANQKSVTFVEGYVGSQEVKCTGHYNAMGQFPAHDSICSRSVSINGPDHDEIDPLFSFDSFGWPEMIVNVFFNVYCGSHRMGGGVNGYPQEWISRPQYGLDGPWSEPAPGEYFLQNGTIVDVKKTNGLHPLWATWQPGDIIDDFYQTNRMVIKNCHLNDVYFQFATRHFRRQKTGADTWRLILVN